MLKSFNPARISGFSKSETSSDLLFLRFALLKAVRSSFDDLNYSLMNLSRLFTVQLSMFFVVFGNSDILSHSEVFVNNFFIFSFSTLPS